MWRVFMIVGVLAGLIGMAFVCPAAAQILQTGDSGWVHVSLLLFGSVVTFAGIASFAVGVQRLRAGTS